MKNLDFKYMFAKNFLCFGPEGIEIHFNKLGNIVLIHGCNLDVIDEEGKSSSNGSGKSSVPEIMVYTLFGKTIKQPKKITHKNVINNQIGKNLCTEIRWGDYRVVRTRQPDSLKLYENPGGDWSKLDDESWEKEVDISLGGMPATQKLIEQKLGFNYETFVNVVVFTDNNAGCFLECDGPTKREIVENLLSLDDYREFGETAKELKNEFKAKVKELASQYEIILHQLDKCRDRKEHVHEQEKQWLNSRKNELSNLKTEEENKRQELESTDDGKSISRYQQARNMIRELMTLIPELEKKLVKLDKMLSVAGDKERIGKDRLSVVQNEIRKHENKIKEINNSVSNLEGKIQSIKNKEGTRCGECFGIVSEENYKDFVNGQQNKISQCQESLSTESSQLEMGKKKKKQVESEITKIQEAIAAAKQQRENLVVKINSARNKISELDKIQKPQDKNTNQAILENQLTLLKEQIYAKQAEIDGPSPFVDILLKTEQEIEEKEKESISKKNELIEAEDDLPYYDFWVKGFGDKGIRKFVIDGIIPALNDRISYWLQFLIDNKIKLKFDNNLEETISRNPPDGDPFVYAQMSRGEQRRLNLAVSQSFAHIMMLNSGIFPSVVFLDEVTTNVDPMGVVGIYATINELAKDRIVFVTTHNQDLLQMLEGCVTLSLEKRGGFTKIS